MRRWRAVICWAIVLGAATNLAVTWAIAAWLKVDIGSWRMGRITTPAGENAVFVRWTGPGVELVRWDVFEDSRAGATRLSPAPRWSGVARRSAFSPPGSPQSALRCESAAGWPMPSLRWCYAYLESSGDRLFDPPYSAILLRDRPGMAAGHVVRTRALPLIPVWPGLALNTLAYAAAWILAVFAFTGVRRRLRLRRSRCPRCAYPIGISSICTECGGDVSRGKTAAQPSG